MRAWWAELSPMKRAVGVVVMAFVAFNFAISSAVAAGNTLKPQDIYTIQAISFIPFATVVLVRAHRQSRK